MARSRSNLTRFDEPALEQTRDEEAAMPYTPDAHDGGELASAENVRRRHEHELLAIDGVQGVALGRNDIGDPAIVVYVREPGVRRRLPTALDGYEVEAVVTGEIDILPA